MQIIQPHYHGIARTAQDYERMAMSGVVAVCEPAFWAGFSRKYRRPSSTTSARSASSSRPALPSSASATSAGWRSTKRQRTPA